MNPSEIRSTLERLGGRANKLLGQNFLIDQSVLSKIVEVGRLKAGERVLEIGPGLGVLTRELLAGGADVLAIEQDRRFIPYLEETFAGMPLSIVQGDAAEVDWARHVGDGPWKFISNLPYQITSFALRKALTATRPPEVLVVLVQREVAERASTVAPDGKTSLLSLMVALYASSVRIVRRVPAGAFFPAPKVESAILEIVPRSVREQEERLGMDPERIMQVAKKGFAHPRKLLLSNLGLSTEARERVVELGIPLKARAEELSPEEWKKLTSFLEKK
jgi:16S rRNA (adenine1518-N6/adenine1519-N6)-dimethyltransferase